MSAHRYGALVEPLGMNSNGITVLASLSSHQALDALDSLVYLPPAKRLFHVTHMYHGPGVPRYLPTPGIVGVQRTGKFLFCSGELRERSPLFWPWFPNVRITGIACAIPSTPDGNRLQASLASSFGGPVLGVSRTKDPNASPIRSYADYRPVELGEIAISASCYDSSTSGGDSREYVTVDWERLEQLSVKDIESWSWDTTQPASTFATLLDSFVARQENSPWS